MSSELIINYRPYETRVAFLENGTLVEFHVERGAQGAGLLGNIYRGRIIRVLPGMQAAFVDLGLEKAAFLYVDDVYGQSGHFEKRLGRANDELEDEATREQDQDSDAPGPARPVESGAGEEPSPPH